MKSLEKFEGLQFRQIADELFTEENLHFTNVQKNILTGEVSMHLWNSWRNTAKGTATGVKIGVQHANKTAVNEFVGGTNPLGQEVIDEKWIEAKSNGIFDPDSKGIVDDGMINFVPIGGNLSNPLNVLSIGNIPANCARKIIFRLRTPKDAASIGMIRFIPFAVAD